MDKRQIVIAAVLGLLAVAAAGGYWWSTQQEEAAPPATTSTPIHHTVHSGPADMAASGSASGATTAMPGAASGHMAGAATSGKPVSDAVALSEEELDKLQQEHKDLDSRAQDLQSQVHDGKALLDMKAKQIKELQAQLKTAR